MISVKKNFTQKNNDGLPEPLYGQGSVDIQVALHEAEGNLYEAAQMLGTTVSVLLSHITTLGFNNAKQDALDIALEGTTALAFKNIIHSIKGGDKALSVWWAERFGGVMLRGGGMAYKSDDIGMGTHDNLFFTKGLGNGRRNICLGFFAKKGFGRINNFDECSL